MLSRQRDLSLHLGEESRLVRRLSALVSTQIIFKAIRLDESPRKQEKVEKRRPRTEPWGPQNQEDWEKRGTSEGD